MRGKEEIYQSESFICTTKPCEQPLETEVVATACPEGGRGKGGEREGRDEREGKGGEKKSRVVSFPGSTKPHLVMKSSSSGLSSLSRAGR